jgi:hypothetical protein
MENPLSVARGETWRRDGNGEAEWLASSSGETALELPPGATLMGAEPSAPGARRGYSRHSGEPGAAAPAEVDAAATDAEGEGAVTAGTEGGARGPGEALPVVDAWRRVVAEDGDAFFFNQGTGESAWALPAGAAVCKDEDGAAEAGAWTRHADGGGMFFFNAATGESAWTLPPGAAVAKEERAPTAAAAARSAPATERRAERRKREYKKLKVVESAFASVTAGAALSTVVRKWNRGALDEVGAALLLQRAWRLRRVQRARAHFALVAKFDSGAAR